MKTKGVGEFLRILAERENYELRTKRKTQAQITAEFCYYFDKAMEIAVARLKKTEAFNH